MKPKNIKYFMTSMLLALNISLTGCAEVVETVTVDSSNEESIEMPNLAKIVEESKDAEEDPLLTLQKELATVDSLYIRGNGKDTSYQIEFFSKDRNHSYHYEVMDGTDEAREYLDSLIFTDENHVYFYHCSDLEISSMISNPENIKSITIVNSPMSHLGFLEDYKNLESLEIQNCPNLDNIDTLWNLTKLRGVQLLGTSVSDISALSNSKDIIFLDLRCNKIEDATPLTNLPRLQTLHLEYNEFWDDETLNFLVENEIISDNRKAIILKTCHSDNISITTEEYVDQTSFNELLISKLERKEDKYYLELRDENGACCLYTFTNEDDDIFLFENTYNKITLANIDDLSILEKIRNKDSITKLTLLSCDTDNLEGLETFSNIKSLNIVNCDSLSDISALKVMPNISSIIIKNTPISDISPLSRVEGLEDLWLSNTFVEDLSPILELPNLKRGYFYWNNFEDSQVLIALRNRGVHVRFNFYTRSKSSKYEKEYINEK